MPFSAAYEGTSMPACQPVGGAAAGAPNPWMCMLQDSCLSRQLAPGWADRPAAAKWAIGQLPGGRRQAHHNGWVAARLTPSEVPKEGRGN